MRAQWYGDGIHPPPLPFSSKRSLHRAHLIDRNISFRICARRFRCMFPRLHVQSGHVQIWRSFYDYGRDEIQPILSFRAHDAQITALQHYCSGAGETLITGGADGLVKGTIRGWTPHECRTDADEVRRTLVQSISQGSANSVSNAGAHN